MEAYHTIPLHPSQWPAAVVCVLDSLFCIDTCVVFGTSPSCGAYGRVADVGAEILRARGIGPVDKWVDDHIFFHILHKHLQGYNAACLGWHKEMTHLGPRYDVSHIYFKGTVLPGCMTEECSEDCRWPIEDLSQSAPRSVHDAHFSYNLEDIDRVSEELGIPWELSKDQPFASSTIYIGFLWDLEAHTITLSTSKRDNYSGAINDWLVRLCHNLKHIQELYGKLLHAASVLPQGRAHLTGLESMLASCAKHPFVPPVLVARQNSLWFCHLPHPHPNLPPRHGRLL